MNKMADFIGELFLARDVTHSTHLNTRSYAKHVALGAFYDEIVDLADALAEMYQGRHGLMGQVPLMSVKKPGNVVEFLQDQLERLEKARYEVCEKTDTPIQNQIDTIIGLYLSTIYKLRFLA